MTPGRGLRPSPGTSARARLQFERGARDGV